MLDLGPIQVLFLLFKHVKINTSSTVKELNVVQTKKKICIVSKLFECLCGLISHSCSTCLVCVYSLLIQNVTSVSTATESSSLLRWSETSLSRWTQTRAIVKVISKPVWDQGERVTSTNTISIAVETGSAQERPLSSHKKTRLLRRAKTNTPTLSTRHWGTDYEAVHKTNHVPRTDNNSETTLRTFKLWSPRRGFFVVFTQTQTQLHEFSFFQTQWTASILSSKIRSNLQTI